MADGSLMARAAVLPTLTGVRILGSPGRHDVEVLGTTVTRVTPWRDQGRSATASDQEILLLPGLVDAHVHLTFLPHAAGAEMSAAGVLTVRDVGGECTRVAEWVASAGLRAPRVLAYGAPLDGSPPEPRARTFGAVPAATWIDVLTHLDRLSAAGASGLKLYFGFPPALAQAAIASAHSRGLRVAAHIGSGTLLGFCDLSPITFAEAGGDTVEHVHSFTAEVLSPGQRESLAQRIDLSPFTRVFLAWAGVDLDAPRVNTCIDRFAATGASLVPTLSVLGLMGGCIPFPGAAEEKGDAQPEDTGLAYVSAGFERMLEFVGRFHGRGGRVVAGTDLAAPSAAVPPSRALALELRLFERAGLSAEEAIEAATARAARALGSGGGEVTVNAPADLVMARASDAREFLARWEIAAVIRAGAVVQGRIPDDVGLAS
ncbi:MAG: amidohydrolase family protein [Gemmatimonadaceae bacterium]